MGSDPRTRVLHLDRRLPRGKAFTETWIAPLGGVYLMALSTRLTMPCRRNVGSHFALTAPSRFHAQRLLLLLRQHAKVLRGPCRQRTDFHHRARQPQASGFRPRQRQEALDEAGQPLDLLQHATDDVAVACRSSESWSATSPTLLIAVSGVRSSCEASP